MSNIEEKKKKPKFNSSLQKKRDARLLAVQILYQNMLNKADRSPEELADGALSGEIGGVPKKVEKKLFREILYGSSEHRIVINEALEDIFGEDKWQSDRFNYLIKSIMFAATFEILYKKNIKPAIIISEYIAVAAAFFDTSEISLINGKLQELVNRNIIENIN